MATNYSKYINSTGTHYISNSGSDEKGNLHGGKAGDQGGEWRLRSWYSRPWTCVLRHPDKTVRRMIAEFGIDAALNDNIGYDQWQRYSYWDALTKSGYKPANVKIKCEADCTAGVTANIKAIGKLLNIPKLYNVEKDTRSGNMRSRFRAADFKALTDKKYLSSPDYLMAGDILLYDNHHAATNISNGKKAAKDSAPAAAPKAGATELKRGDVGDDVRTMQRLLLAWSPSILPKYGADGDFGAETEAAVKLFQQAAGLTRDGVYNAETEAALKRLYGPKNVVVTGDTVNIRAAAGTAGNVLGIAHKGDALPYQGQSMENGGSTWYLIEYKNANAWISGKYSKIDG